MIKISENVIELVQNPFGNYAVTEVINVIFQISKSFLNLYIELGFRSLQAYFPKNPKQVESAEYPEVFFKRDRTLFGEGRLEDKEHVH